MEGERILCLLSAVEQNDKKNVKPTGTGQLNFESNEKSLNNNPLPAWNVWDQTEIKLDKSYKIICKIQFKTLLLPQLIATEPCRHLTLKSL